MIDRHVLEIIPLSSPKQQRCLLSVNQTIQITNDGRGIAESLAHQLIEKGYRRTQIVEHISPECDVVIALDGLAQFANINEAIHCNARVFHYAKTVANRFSERGGIFITVQTTGGQFKFNQRNEYYAWTSGLAALVKTAAQEWPRAICHAIDLEINRQTSDELAQMLFKHLLGGHTQLECGLLANGKIITPQLTNAALNIKTLDVPIDKNTVIVASGGARGITASCLLTLAKNYQPHIILLGRTSLKAEDSFTASLSSEQEIRHALITHYKSKQESFTLPTINQKIKSILAQREATANIALLKSTGAEVSYFDCDILNLDALDTVFTQIRKQHGKISGILHGAGVLSDKLILQKSNEQFDHVFNTKVYGLKNLLAVTQQDKLRFLLLFSSVAARFGNVGQSDYAMANEVLNKVAQQEQQKRGKSCFVKSYNWGPWESGMVTQELAKLFAQRGIKLLSTEHGTQLFLHELTDPHHVEVIFGGRLDHVSSLSLH